MNKKDDLLGILYCTKHDDFIDNLSVSDLNCNCINEDCKQCSHLNIVTNITMKAIYKNGEVLDLE